MIIFPICVLAFLVCVIFEELVEGHRDMVEQEKDYDY